LIYIIINSQLHGEVFIDIMQEYIPRSQQILWFGCRVEARNLQEGDSTVSDAWRG
jgi:hypothetical protein